VLFDKLDTEKVHELDTFDVSRRDVTSQVELGLMWCELLLECRTQSMYTLSRAK